MLKREIVVPPEHLYPPDEWRVVEARYSEEFFERAETVFSLSNGFVGVRVPSRRGARRCRRGHSSRSSSQRRNAADPA
jgi:alpha,alpha-trehalose phosphorylase